MSHKQNTATPLAQITPAQWERLRTRAIYFGHQSVGANIIEGIREMAAAMPELRVRVTSDPSPEVGLHEFQIGRNTDPASKNAAFLAATDDRLGPRPVLMFKYCYVDVAHDTDTGALFGAYRKTVDALRARHADATIVHFTIPLTAESSRLRYCLNTLRGMPTARTQNARRHEYNECLRAAFAAEPIYDLAAIEATRSDGTLEAPVPALAREWTSDGGHLNAAGRRRAAEELLVLLATLT